MKRRPNSTNSTLSKATQSPKARISSEPAHAEFGASNSDRWLNCPASHELVKKSPELPETKWAVEGTLAHECLEALMLAGIQRPFGKPWTRAVQDAAKALLLTPPKYERSREFGFYEYSSEMIQHALDAAKWIFERYYEYAADGTPNIMCETKVDASSFTAPGQFGTVDAAIIREFRSLEVIDFKYGAGVAVDVRDAEGKLNSQLAYYTLGIAHQYEYWFKDIAITVIQPRASHRDGPIRTAHVSMSELLEWRDIFLSGVAATRSPRPAFKAGKWCRFCAAKVGCPEIRDGALKEAKAVFADDGELTVPTKDQTIATMVFPNETTRLLEACDKLEIWIAGVREAAFNQLKAGTPVPGWKIVDKYGRRVWDQIGVAESEALRRFGDDAFSPGELLSPAQFEKKFGKGGRAFLDKYTSQVSSGRTMVRDTDKRPPAARLSARDAFEGLDDDE